MKAIMKPRKCLRIILSIFVLSFAALSFPEQGLAQVSPSWHTNGPDGGLISAIALSPNYPNDQTVFVSASDGGIYKSTNQGDSWTPVSERFYANFIALSPNYASDQTLFAGGRFGTFFRSTDGGQIWTGVDLPLSPETVTNIALSPNFANDHTVLVVTQGSLLHKSVDGGITWTSIGNTPNNGLSGFFIGPGYPIEPVIYIGESGGIYKSVDDGQTWTRIFNYTTTVFSMSPDFANDHMLLTNGGPGGFVMKSVDEGVSWTALSVSAFRAISFSANFANDGTIFVNDPYLLGRMKKSTDRGETWVNVDTGYFGSPAADLYRIVTSPNYINDNTVFAGTPMGILRSRDGGSSWTFVNNGIHEAMEHNFVAASPNYANDHTVFDASWGIHKSTDGGLTWQLVSRGINGQNFSSIFLSPNFATDGVAMVASSCLFSRPFKTTDGGQTWVQLEGIPCPEWTGSGIRAFGISPSFASDQTVFVTSFVGIFKSTDGGASWQAAYDGITNLAMSALAVSPNFGSDQTVFAIGGTDLNSGSLYKTINGGQTWIAAVGLPTNLRTLAISPNYATDHTVVVTNSSSVYRSTDEGNSWSIISNQLLNPSMLVFSKDYSYDSSLYAAAAGGVFVSRNGGVTWSSLNMPYNPFYIAVGNRGAQADIFAGVSGRGVWQTTLAQPNEPPTADAGGPYPVNEGGSVQVSATGQDIENGPLTYAWDLDNNGSFETPGQNVIFSAAGIAGPSSRTIAVQVMDNGGLSSTDTATVNILSVLRITTESPLPAGYVGVAYSVTLEATGGVTPYTWSIIGGALPPGLSLNTTSGKISGVPTTAGTFGFTVQVEDSSGLVITRQFTLQPPPPTGSAGSGYSAQLNVVDVPPDAPPPEGGQPPTCSNYHLVSGTLPDGVTLNSETGIISGVPLDGGTYTFTVECVVANQTATKDFTITIYNPTPTITQLIPNEVLVGSGDFTLRVLGSNFVQSSIVHFNGENRPTTFIFSTELEASISNSDILSPGTADVLVVNPEPNGGISNVVNLSIVANQPPTADAGGPYSVDEGSLVPLSAIGIDPESGILDYAWDLDNNGSFETTGQQVNFSAAVLDGPSIHTVGVKVTDDRGLTAIDQATVNVLNVAPTVGAITAPLNPMQVSTAISTNANFSDSGTPDTHTAVWDWGDNSTSPGTVTEANGSGSVSGNHIYSTSGVYTVKVTVTDDDGASDQAVFQYIVIYDPNGGFVTGGGWIWSPEGAYSPNPTLTGKATFGFVSKYQKGATVPTGNTEFQFHVANMNFKSTSYDWLAIAGTKAQFKGTGTINGTGEYKFMLTAIDGTPDKFRIKIWDKVTGEIIYDNQLGTADTAEPSTAIQGGSIVIHKLK